MTEAELREYDFPGIGSYDGVHTPASLEAWARLPVRIRMGLTTTPREIDAERKLLQENPKAFLMKRRGEALKRLKAREKRKGSIMMNGADITARQSRYEVPVLGWFRYWRDYCILYCFCSEFRRELGTFGSPTHYALAKGYIEHKTIRIVSADFGGHARDCRCDRWEGFRLRTKKGGK
jgi:hypothetical protein